MNSTVSMNTLNKMNSDTVRIIPRNDTNYDAVNELLEKEKITNKKDNWNKLDKNSKIQKLNKYAEKYVAENGLNNNEVVFLKLFLVDCLERMKLQKTKDVVCDKHTKEIVNIPALCYDANASVNPFTLKNIDTKRVSTVKSLTPKKNTSTKNTSCSTVATDEEMDIDDV